MKRRLVWILVTVGLAAALWYGYRAYRDYAAGMRPGLYRVAEAPGERIKVDMRPQSPPERLVNAFAPDARPKNLILIIGDGFGFNQMSAARIALKGANGRLFMERFPVSGWMWTHSLEELYTDSAAGASALATGCKTRPLMLSQTPEGVPQRTFLEAGMEKGMRAALITTSTIFDATPAAFVVHHKYRRDYAAVNAQLAASGVELLLSEGVDPEAEPWKEIWPGILETYRASGYRVAQTWEEVETAAAKPGERLLGLLPPGSLSEERSTSPCLEELSTLALERLADAEQGFFLLVEDEDVDTHSHKGNMDRVVAAVAALDEVARQAVDFAQANGETLVLITADHETGALVLIGGKDGADLDYRWIHGNHSVSPVPLLAYGPGAERFSGVLDNTDVPRILDELLDLGLF
ncbi:MAG: alkaline phosphatase [Acidobacteria bacterium]|nr:alkaline phosphatase [Acidobacteriota bacterium]